MELPMAQRALFVHAIADEEEIRRYGVTAPIVSAINGIDLPEPRSPDEGRDILDRFGIPRSRTVFLFLGRLDIPQKGLDVLLRGFARFRQSSHGGLDSHLVLAGPTWGGSTDSLAKLAAELGISDRVTLPGGVFGDEKAALISGCHFFVHPSRWEAGVPFSVLEALSHGKQCLVTSVIDQEGTLQKAGVCQVCDLDEEGVATSLQILGDQSEEEGKRLALRARELIRAEFSWEEPAKALVEGYRRHLALRSPGGADRR
jgi:glycosyltransferase involved in cell wall biosynthesis